MLLSFLGSFLRVVDDHLAPDVRGCGSAVAGNAALWQAGLPAGSRGRLGIPLQSITSSFDHGGLQPKGEEVSCSKKTLIK